MIRWACSPNSIPAFNTLAGVLRRKILASWPPLLPLSVAPGLALSIPSFWGVHPT